MRNNNAKKQMVAGQPFDGLSASVWNWLTEQYAKSTSPAFKLDRATSTEVDVQNLTGSPLSQVFRIVQVDGPIIGKDDNENEFWSQRQVTVTTPSEASSVIAITHEPLSEEAIGTATVLGIVPCEVFLQDEAHQFAGPTSSSDYLVSGESGPAKIIWLESDNSTDGRSIGTGPQWALVLLTNNEVDLSDELEALTISIEGYNVSTGQAVTVDPVAHINFEEQLVTDDGGDNATVLPRAAGPKYSGIILPYPDPFFLGRSAAYQWFTGHKVFGGAAGYNSGGQLSLLGTTTGLSATYYFSILAPDVIPPSGTGMGPPSDSNILATLAATAKINQSLTYGNSYAIGDIYANDPREGEMNFNWSFNGAYQHHSYQLLNISHLNDPVVNGSAGHIGGSGRLRFSWGDDRYTGHDGTIDQWWVHARRVRYFAAPSQGTSFEIPSGNFFVGPGAGSTGPIINPVGWLRVGVFDTQGLNSTTHLVGQHGLGSGGGPPSAGVNVGGIILSAISVTNGFPTQGTAPRCLTSVFGHTVHVSGPGATLIGPGDISTYWRGTPTDGPSGWFATGASSGVISGSTCITGTSVCINSHNIVMAGGIAVARSGGQITNQNGGNAVGLAATLTVEHPDIPGHFFDLFRNGFFMGGPIPLKLSGSTESGYVGGNNNIEGALGTANGGLGQSNPGTAGAFLVGTGASATYTESSTVREAVSAGIIETLVDTGIWSRTTSITI